MTVIRLILIFTCVYLANLKAVENVWGEAGNLSNFAFSALMSIFSAIYFCYGVYLFYVSRKLNLRIEKHEILFSFVAILGLPFSLLGFDVFSIYFVGLAIAFCALVNLKGEKVRVFIWDHRFHEFSQWPDDGNVTHRQAEKLKLIVLVGIVIFVFSGLFLGKIY